MLAKVRLAAPGRFVAPGLVAESMTSVRRARAAAKQNQSQRRLLAAAAHLRPAPASYDNTSSGAPRDSCTSWPARARGLDALVDNHPSALGLTVCRAAELDAWLLSQPEHVRRWLNVGKLESGTHSVYPGEDGRIAGAIMVVPDGGAHIDLQWHASALAQELPSGLCFQLDHTLEAEDATAVAMGWALAQYKFDRYKSKPSTRTAQLVWPASSARQSVIHAAQAMFFGRDLINTPAEDLTPRSLANEARALCASHAGADITVMAGAQLKDAYPAVWTVGRAAQAEPVLIDIHWETPLELPLELPLVTLVGKGVCFDTGGLDLKPSSAMALMKKDMGGAATVLALAHMIMSAELPVRLRVLVPAVENAVGGHAFRTSDVIRTHKGVTVEVGNTDAEGRLILSDALAHADAEAPDLLVDIATLTGAARSAVGPQVSAYFSNNNELAQLLDHSSAAVGDYTWRLPLHQPYLKMLDSKVADIMSAPVSGGMAGAITAALFLEQFVGESTRWLHVDTMAYTTSQFARAGQPEGGEPTPARALFELLSTMYPCSSAAPNCK